MLAQDDGLTPLGATMVSSEGACAAYYQYGRFTSISELTDSSVDFYSLTKKLCEVPCVEDLILHWLTAVDSESNTSSLFFSFLSTFTHGHTPKNIK